MELPPNESKYIFIEIDFTLTAVAILERMNSNSIVFFSAHLRFLIIQNNIFVTQKNDEISECQIRYI